jgi:hypothetical protein
MKVYKFVAHGKYPFPLDMLRYDCCYPSEPGAVDRIQQGIVGPREDAPFRDRPILDIRLISHVHAPTEDRWRSFGWFIEGLEVGKI